MIHYTWSKSTVPEPIDDLGHNGKYFVVGSGWGLDYNARYYELRFLCDYENHVFFYDNITYTPSILRWHFQYKGTTLYANYGNRWWKCVGRSATLCEQPTLTRCITNGFASRIGNYLVMTRAYSNLLLPTGNEHLFLPPKILDTYDSLQNGQVFVYNFETTPMQTYRLLNIPCYAVCLAPDCQTFAVAYQPNEVFVLDVEI